MLRMCGIEITRYKKRGSDEPANHQDCQYRFSEQNKRIYDSVKQYTMTNPERIDALIESVRYLETSGLEGAFVECGVWKGGSVMAMALALKELKNESRDIYLYDTFSGMSQPSDVDISIHGEKASEKYLRTRISGNSSEWCMAPWDEVRKNIISMNYPEEKFHVIKGKVEDTIPYKMPKEIAMLRLDTDWYESTKHELIHLYPLLRPGGVLIIDDYGHWEGVKKATDEYFTENKVCIFLHRIDYGARIAIKIS